MSTAFGLLPLVNNVNLICGPVLVFRVGSCLDLSYPHCCEGIESIGLLLDHGLNDLRVCNVITFLEMVSALFCNNLWF